MSSLDSEITGLKSRKLHEDISCEEVVSVIEKNLDIENPGQSIEILRILRNYVCDPVFSSYIMESKRSVWEKVCLLFKKYITEFETQITCEEKILLLLRICIQFYGNLSAGKSKYKSDVWKVVLPNLRILISQRDKKMSCYSAMVVYNSLLKGNVLNNRYVRDIYGIENSAFIIQNFCKLIINEQSEFSLFLIKKLLLTEELNGKTFLDFYFPELIAETRSVILDILFEMISNIENEPLCPEISKIFPCITFISNFFQENVAMNLNPLNSDCKYTILEISKCLQILCVASSNDKISDFSKMDIQLLECSLNVLRLLVTLAKSSDDNDFKPCQNLNSFEKEFLSPTDGFKKDIIRLIANLCFEHQDNQNTVRKLDGIYYILDSCSLDSHNPYIIQWCVFAIRNLCSKNEENQRLIAEIQSKGKVVPSAILDELKIKVVGTHK